MDCPTCEAMVDAYVDGELPPTESVAMERSLETCPACRRRLEAARQMRRLLRDLPDEPVPDLLHARIERELRALAAGSTRRVRRGGLPWRAGVGNASWSGPWIAWAASVLVALGIGWFGGSLASLGPRESDELVAGYIRVNASDRGVEVASSDRHTVKPWFAGRIDYAPPVHDLAADSFPLLGGRIDVVDGRKTAVLVYRHNQHRIALTLWPSAGGSSTEPGLAQRDGFAMARWRHGGFEMRAVADMSPSKMTLFAAALDRAIDADH